MVALTTTTGRPTGLSPEQSFTADGPGIVAVARKPPRACGRRQPRPAGVREHPGMDLDRVARRQQGVVSRAQALEAGLSPGQVRWRLQRGRWRAIHPGVYLTNNGTVDWPSRARAALLRCGRGSVLILSAACYLWRLERTPPAVVTVGVPTDRHPEPADGLVVVRRRRLEPVTVDGLPVTRLPVTVLDMADRPGCSVDDAVALAARACQERAVDAAALRRELDGRRRHQHRRELRLAFAEVGNGAESLPETTFETTVRRPHGLPAFERQVVEDDGSRTDLKNREFGTNVEIDGRLWHAGERFHLDRRRDRRAVGRGEVTLRVAPVEMVTSPCEVARDLALALRHRGWVGPPRPCGPGCAVGAP